MTKRTLATTVAFAILSMLALLAVEAAARGGRGGGRPNISRSGPASGGSFGRSGRRSGFESRQGNRGGRMDNRQGGRSNRQQGDPQRDRSDRQDNRRDNSGDRQDNRRDNSGDRQDNRYDNREEIYDDHGGGHGDRHEFYEDRWRHAAGAALTATAFRALTCASRTVVVDGVSYYNCGPTWYNRSYVGGSVSYVVVDTPPGY